MTQFIDRFSETLLRHSLSHLLSHWFWLACLSQSAHPAVDDAAGQFSDQCDLHVEHPETGELAYVCRQLLDKSVSDKKLPELEEP